MDAKGEMKKAWEAYQPLRQGRDSIWAAFEAGFVAAASRTEGGNLDALCRSISTANRPVEARLVVQERITEQLLTTIEYLQINVANLDKALQLLLKRQTADLPN
jgi:hypothetical protein